MEGLSVQQRETLAAYWWRRAEGEITSWIGFQHVLKDLEAEGSPAAVLELAQRAVADEYQHAMFCRDWAVHFGHAPGTPEPRSHQVAQLPGLDERHNRLFRIALCCMTETVGCFLLRQVRPLIKDPTLRRLNRRHLADELRHSRVGWGHLSTLDAASRAMLQELLPTIFRVVQAVCCDGPEQEFAELVPYGYFTPSLLRAAYDEALAEVIHPGLAHLGFKAAA
jgi:hypothetical protein